MGEARRSVRVLLALTIAVAICSNVIWVLRFRSGQLYDIDEAGYLSIALNEFHSLVHGGPFVWLATIEGPSIQAPFMMALTSLAFGFWGGRPIIGIMVVVAFGFALVLLTYLLGKSIKGPVLGLLAAILVAFSPIIVNYSRDYTFAVPAAAVSAACMLALVNSRHLARLGWSLGFGILLGLLPLTLTMTIAFLPGFLIPAFLQAVRPGHDRVRRLRNFVLSLAVAAAVGAAWFLPNGNGYMVLSYLTSYGYGKRVAEYASSHVAHGILHNLITVVPTLQYFVDQYYLLGSVIIIFGLLMALVLSVIKLTRVGPVGFWSAIMRNDVSFAVFLSFEGLLAIASSQNRGSGFLAPITPMLFISAIWCLNRLFRSRASKRALVGLVATCSIAPMVPMLWLSWPIAAPLSVPLPVVGCVPVSSGEGVIQQYESAGGYKTANPNIPVNRRSARRWILESVRAADLLYRIGGYRDLTAFGFRNRLFNVNTVMLEQLLLGRNPLPLTQISPQVTGDTVRGYEAWLTSGTAAQAELLVTAEGTNGDFSPTVNDSRLVAAARLAGFKPIDRWYSPTGRRTTLWRRWGG